MKRSTDQGPGSLLQQGSSPRAPQCSWLYLGHPFQTPPPAAGPRISGLRLSLLHLHTPDKVGAGPNPQRVLDRQGWGRGLRLPPSSTKVVGGPKKLVPRDTQSNTIFMAGFGLDTGKPTCLL